MCPWYLDFYLPNGGSNQKVHLFFQDKEKSPFKDCGVVKEIKEDFSNLDMDPCLGVKVVNGDFYLLEPMAFVKDLMKANQEGETMSKAGWIDLTQETPTEDYIDIYIGSFKKFTQYLGNLRAKKSKKRKVEDTSDTTQKRASKESEVASARDTSRNEKQVSFPLVFTEEKPTREAYVPTSILVAVVVDLALVAVLNSIV